jgi:integrase/recombinase XerD
LRAYKLQSELLIRHIGDRELNEVAFEDLKGYLIAQDHLKPASIGHRVRFLKSFSRWAHEEGLIAVNPAAKLREPKQGKRVPKPLPEEDLETLTVCCQSPLEHALVDFLFTTGCRIGEVYGINRRDLNWETRSVIVRGKGDKEREVYFSIRCAIWLKKYFNARQDNDPALFATGRRPYRRMSIAQMRYILKRVASRAGVETSVYPHRMRHSYACHLLENGAPLELIQTLLGHEKLETTRLYAALSGPRRRELYRRYF